ncbi:proline--tRNA ligase [Buchnera aphidicola]|uniref:Proline--tRNA ligase n=1 Tax=Buchnera aphidicola (Sarucallis kahawaluokalani) TaxID=1241878 RepID=A0A4D6YCT8_9GAMM|nr:proline--tRNA ligase [Buchnera aphidicola]QCI25963.1 proline--tRNA ligase [Buchnera aphidicola (Sarucallis kahawaluokalani)]
MRTNQYLLYTLQSIPKNIDTSSHQLMLKAGLVRKTHSGLYTWLPNGLKVLQKIKKIIRKEMNHIQAIEICFPILQSDSLWKKSNRFYQYGKELIKIYDRNHHTFILSPTYEEMATDFIKKEIKSYKKLPVTLYQIQKKFRDEIRPRGGIIRAKEFIMKDAYSFHYDKKSLQDTYKKIYLAYERIFKKMQLKFYSVKADCGIIGGNYSHEFQAIAKNGEDKLIILKTSEKKKKIQLITKDYIIKNFFYKKKIPLKNVHQTSILHKNFIKIYIMKYENNINQKFFGYIIRGDHVLNIEKIMQKKNDVNHRKIVFPTKKEMNNIIQKIKKKIFFIPIIIDTHILYLKSLILKMKINEIYYNINFIDQTFQSIQVSNIIKSPIKKIYKIKNCIEVGHIFQIGKQYSQFIDLKILNKNKIRETVYMGCYGIGVTRLIAAIIEQHHDQKGIIWPKCVAPFELLIIPIFFHKCKKIKKISEKLYHKFKKNKIEVLLEDRNEHINVIFSDANLIGIPNIIIINNNTLKNNTVEYQERKNITKKNIIDIKNIYEFIINKIKKN